MSSVDTRIVEMQFNNKQFEKGIQTSMKSLDQFQKSLDFDESTKSLSALEKVGKSFSLPGIAAVANSCDNLLNKFKMVVEYKFFSRLESQARGLLKSLTIDQVTSGWDKYNQKTASVQTIMNATGKSIDEVNGYLDKLMWFSDETSYSFTDMTQSLGQLTSSGGKIEKLVPMLEGIANATAFAGKGSAEFSRAIYNLNQSYAAGSLQYIDWKSLEQANIASEQLKQTFIDTGVALGKIRKGEVTVANFNQTLSKKWATTEVMEKAFGYFAEMTEKAYEMVDSGEVDSASKAYAILAKEYDTVSLKAATAAQEAKTFDEAIGAAKDAVSSGWMDTFSIIFGDYDKAKVLWTDLANGLWEVFAAPMSNRNDMLREWANELNGRQELIDGLYAACNALWGMIQAVRDGFQNIFPPSTAEQIQKISSRIKAFGENLQAAFDWDTAETRTSTTKIVEDLDKLDEELSKGKTGDSVKELQERLIELGYDLGSYGADGIFGSKTQAALQKFQEDMGLAANGVYNLDTKVALFKKLGLDKVVERESKVFNVYGKRLKSLRSIAKGLASVLKILLAPIKFVGKVIGHILKLLSPLADALLTIFGVLGDCVTNLQKVITESDFFGKALERVKKALGPFGDFIQKVSDAISDFFTNGEGLDTFVGLWDKLKTTMKSFTTEFLKEHPKLTNALNAIKTKLDPIVKTVEEFGNKAWASIKTFFSNAWIAIKNFASNIPAYWEKIKTFFVGLYESVKGNEKLQAAWASIKTFFSNAWIAIKNFASNIPAYWEKIKTFFVGLYESVKGNEKLQAAWEKIKEFFSSIWNTLKTFFSGGSALGEKGKSVFDTVFEWVSEKWQALKALFLKIYNEVKEFIELVGPFGLVGLLVGSGLGIFAITNKLKGNKNNLNKATNMILDVAVAIGIIGAAILVLGSMDSKAFLRGVTTVGAISTVLIALSILGLILSSKKKSFNAGSEISNSVLNFAKAIALIGISLVALGLLQKSALKGAKVVGGIMAAMLIFEVVARLISRIKTGGTTSALTEMFNIAKAVAILGAAIIILGLMPSGMIKKGIKYVAAIMGLILAFELMARIISNIPAKDLASSMPNILKIAGAIAILAGAVIAISVISKFFDVQSAIGVLAEIMGLFVVFVGLLAFINKQVGPTAVGLKGVLSSCIGIALIIGVFGYALEKSKKIPWETVASLGGSVAACLYGLVKAMKAAKTLDPKNAVSLLLACVGVAVMIVAFGYAANLAASMSWDQLIAMGAGLALTFLGISGAIKILSGVNFIGGLAAIGLLDLFVGTLGGILIGLADLAINTLSDSLASASGALKLASLNISDFSSTMNGADTGPALETLKSFFEVFKDVPSMGKSIAMSSFAGSMAISAGGILDFAESVNGLGGGALQNVKNSVKIVECWRDISSLMDEMKGKNFSRATIDGYATAFANLGSGLELYAMGTTNLDSEEVSEAEAYADHTTRAINILTELVKNIPDDLSSVAELAPDDDGVSSFGVGLVTLGNALVKFGDTTKDIDEAKMASAGNAIGMLAEMQKSLGKEGGLGPIIASFFAGVDQDIPTFSNNISTLGLALGSFARNTKDVHIVKTTGMVLMVEQLSEIQSSLTKSGGVWQWLTGESSFSDFGTNLINLGQGLADFSTQCDGIDVDKVGNATSVIENLSTAIGGNADSINKALWSFNDFFKSKKKGNGELAQAIIDFSNDLEDYDPTTVNTAVSSITSAMQSMKNLESYTPNSEAISSNLSGLSSAITSSIDVDDISSSMSGVTSAISSGLSSDNIDTSGVSTALSSCVTLIQNYNSSFQSAGKYLSLGLARGISSGRSNVITAAVNVMTAAISAAKRKAEIASPSKVMTEAGMFFDEGFALGITKFSGKVTNAASSMSGSAVSTIQNTLSNLGTALMNDVDADPVIRPVVDLTNVATGAQAISGMLSANQAFGISADVSANMAAAANPSAIKSNQNGSSLSQDSVSNTSNNALNLTGNNFYVRSEQDIRSLASEIATLSSQQQRALGAAIN